MELDQELQSLYSQLTVRAQEPVPVPTADPVPPTPAPVPVPAPVPPKAGEPAPVLVPAPVVAIDPDQPVDNWELEPAGTPAPVPVTPSPVVDFSELAKELGVENAKTKEELIRALKDLNAKNANPPVLPEDLAKAVEIAQQGGNYLEYLRVSAIDWQKQDPVILFENWVYNSLSGQGKTAEEIDAYLDKIDDMDKELRGRELQNQYSAHQHQQRAAIENQTKFEKERFNNATQSALSSIGDVYGFKLSSMHKDSLYTDFTSTPIGRVLLTQSNGDFKQALTGLFNLKYGAKIDQFRKQQIKNAVKRDILNELQNPNLNTPTPAAAPDAGKVDPIALYLSDLKKSTGL